MLRIPSGIITLSLVLPIALLQSCGGGGSPPTNDNSDIGNDNSNVTTNENESPAVNENDNSSTISNSNTNDNSTDNTNDNGGPPEPPIEATVNAGENVLVEPGNLVALQATLQGPIPVTIFWTSDPENPIEPFDFVDQGTGLATFTAPTLLNFIFDLNFTVTATYSNGGTLSDSVTITVMGGPG